METVKCQTITWLLSMLLRIFKIRLEIFHSSLYKLTPTKT